MAGPRRPGGRRATGSPVDPYPAQQCGDSSKARTIHDDEGNGVTVARGSANALIAALERTAQEQTLGTAVDAVLNERSRLVSRPSGSNGVVGAHVVRLVVLTGLSSKQLSDLVNIGRAVPLALSSTPSAQVRAVRQRRLSPDERAEIVVGYRSGSSMAELAKRFRVRRSRVSQVLKAAGVAARGQRILEAGGAQEAIRLYADGWSLQRIGEYLGFDPETIRTHLKRQGVVLRPAHRLGRDQAG